MRKRRYLRLRKRIAQLERDLGWPVTEPELLSPRTPREAAEKWTAAASRAAANYSASVPAVNRR